MAQTLSGIFKIRRGTNASLASIVLQDGEIGYATDTKVEKIGDGVLAWSALDSISVASTLYATSAGSCSGNAATASKFASVGTLTLNGATGTTSATSDVGTYTLSVAGLKVNNSALADAATVLQTARTIAISGKVTGTATSFNGSANISISTTAAAILSSEITDATALNTASMVVKRDVSGNFAAAMITSNLTGEVTGNASTATKLYTARNINGVSFDGSANITVTAAANDVYAWAKAATKPSYTYSEVGAPSSSGTGATGTGWAISISGSAGTLATARAIYGNNFDGSAALTQVIASTYGGTGNGFTKFTGPATAERTFTLPNQDATILYSGGALGTPTSGTLTNCTFPTLNQSTTGNAATATTAYKIRTAAPGSPADGDIWVA